MKEFNWDIIFQDFKRVKLSGALTALYSSRVIQQIAGGLLGVFLPVFLYIKLDYSLVKVGIYFFLSYLLWFFLVPIGARIMSWIGLKKALIVSVLFGVLYYFFLNKFDQSNDLFYLGLVLVAINIDRMLYWIPYHVDFSKFTNRRNRGKQMSFLLIISSLVSVALPFISGVVIEQYDFSILFVISMFLYVASAIPLFLIPEKKEKFNYSYFQSYKEAFSKKHRKMFWSFAADGAQWMVGVAFWPIFIWLVLDQDYSTVGGVTAIVIFFTIALRLIIGDFTDRMDKKKLLKWGTWFYSVGWIFKMFVATGFQIFIASTYHNFANIVMRTPFDTLMYQQMAESGRWVDEYNVLREISLNFGRVLMAALVIGIFIGTGSLVATFVVAAGASLVMNLL